MIDSFVWNSEVQQNELDIQKIVNNAVYLNYFSQARIHHLLSKGIDWEEWHRKGINIVLIHADIAFKHSLKAHDRFYIKSTYKKSGKLKIVFDQAIYKSSNNKLVATGINTLTCVSVQTEKLFMPSELVNLLFK